jgi:hypothetical protein
MNRLSKILEIAGMIITFGRGLHIELKPCRRGHTDIKIERDDDNNMWLVHCPQCRLPTTWYNRRWKAKRAWNKMVSK